MVTNGASIEQAASAQEAYKAAFDDILSKDSAANDLSAGSVSPKVLADDSIALKELQHRHGLQQSVFSCAIAAAVLLYFSAVIFAGMVLSHSGPGQIGSDWHSSLLAGAFIVPPTVMVVVLIRSVYSSTGSKGASADDLPSVSFAKEIVSIAKDLASLGK